jgi:hypothetical protein
VPVFDTQGDTLRRPAGKAFLRTTTAWPVVRSEPISESATSFSWQAWKRGRALSRRYRSEAGFRLTDRCEMASAASADLAPIGEVAHRLCEPVARATKRSR